MELLPNEILCNIISYLSDVDIISLMYVNKKLSLLSKDDNIWIKIVFSKYGKVKKMVSWYNTYKNMNVNCYTLFHTTSKSSKFIGCYTDLELACDIASNIYLSNVPGLGISCIYANDKRKCQCRSCSQQPDDDLIKYNDQDDYDNQDDQDDQDNYDYYYNDNDNIITYYYTDELHISMFYPNLRCLDDKLRPQVYETEDEQYIYYDLLEFDYGFIDSLDEDDKKIILCKNHPFIDNKILYYFGIDELCIVANKLMENIRHSLPKSRENVINERSASIFNIYIKYIKYFFKKEFLSGGEVNSQGDINPFFSYDIMGYDRKYIFIEKHKLNSVVNIFI